MAEFLIKKEPNWMDKLSTSEQKKFLKHRKNQEKFNERSRVGDVVQVQVDGKWGPYAHAGKMYHLKVPDMPFEEALQYRAFWERPYTQEEITTLVNEQVAKHGAQAAPFNEPAFRAEHARKLSNKKNILAKRRYGIDVSAFPALQDSPILTITKAEFLAALIDKA
jgi:hypothetical protein